MGLRQRLIGFIAIVQSVLFLTHLLLYKTWTFSPAGNDTPGVFWIKLVLGFLSVSFLFIAAALTWIIFGVTRLAGLDVNFHRTVEWLFGAAVLAGLYGVFNASWTRITRTTVRLANLPDAWRGRKAALISDLHLGHVRNAGFLRRMVAKILNESRTQFLLPAICMTARPST